MRTYIMSVVSVFGHEACMIVKMPLLLPRPKTPPPAIGVIVPIRDPLDSWDLSFVETVTKDFMRDFAIQAYREKHAGTIQTLKGEIEHGIWNGLLHSPEWIVFQEERLAIAELITNGPSVAPPPVPPELRKSAPVLPKIKSLTAIAIESLRAESRMTMEDLATETKFSLSTVSRHENGEITPQAWRISTYERVFSKRLNRKVVIPVTPIKRN